MNIRLGWLAAIALPAAAMAQDAPVGAGAGPGGSVCARLAPQLGLKREAAKRGEVPTWRAGMFGVGAMLFGGSAGVSFMVQPVEGTTQAQITDSCKQVKSDIVCRVTGPSRIVVGSKKGEAGTDLAPGERAEVGTKGKHIFCRENG